jgi:hypothetical protein
MTGPQGPDPSQQWSGQPPAWGQPTPGAQPDAANPAWQQPPAYSPEQYQQYPATGQPAAGYPPQQFGQPEYNPAAGYPAAGYGAPQPGQPYGQPQFAQQFGQPQYGQAAQFDQQFGAPPSGNKPSKKLIAIAGAVAAVAVIAVGVLGFVWPGWFVTTKLDVNAAQTGVQKVLSDETNGYGAKNVKDVKCNNGQDPEVKPGTTFNCDVSIDGTKRSVTVKFQDDKGTYEVGRPK